jgi:dynactin-4
MTLRLCGRCEHNLSKPEYNPTSIKFKIQLAAYYHVPEIVIHRVGNLAQGITSQFVIKVPHFLEIIFRFFFPKNFL